MGLGDPYSEYYSAEEYRALKEATSGHFYGIGAVSVAEKYADMINSITIIHMDHI